MRWLIECWPAPRSMTTGANHEHDPAPGHHRRPVPAGLPHLALHHLRSLRRSRQTPQPVWQSVAVLLPLRRHRPQTPRLRRQTVTLQPKGGFSMLAAWITLALITPAALAWGVLVVRTHTAIRRAHTAPGRCYAPSSVDPRGRWRVSRHADVLDPLPALDTDHDGTAGTPVRPLVRAHTQRIEQGQSQACQPRSGQGK